MTQTEFIEHLKNLNISISAFQLEQLNKYYQLLVETNKVMNLTAIVDKNEVYLKHFYDSLTIVKVIDLEIIHNLCDIGTGAGFPGLVIGILFPKLQVTLVDSMTKRIKFLQLVIDELKLKNIVVVVARAENYALTNREEFDIVTARAVASLNILLEYCIPIIKVNGRFVAMKGNVDEEILSSKNALTALKSEIEKIVSFKLPKENSHRTIINIRKKSVTPLKYPRKFNEMKKRPL